MNGTWRSPTLPASWYFACSTAELRKSEVLARPIGARLVAIFRTKAGSVHAIDAHCGHLGANLGHGMVVDDRLRCPLHHLEYDTEGRCAFPSHREHSELSLASYPTTEAAGAIFVFNVPHGTVPPPAFANQLPNGSRISVGRAVRVACPWYAVVTNAFDLHHLAVVHRRSLAQPALVERPDAFRFRLQYMTRVAGNTLSDRVIRWLSRDAIHATITCFGGTIICVESTSGRWRAMLLLCLVPNDGVVDVVPIFAVPRSRGGIVDAPAVWLARWLYTSFLERDVEILDGMHFHPRPILPEDDALLQCLAYLDSLPVP